MTDSSEPVDASSIQTIVDLIEKENIPDEDLHELILDCASGIGANICNSDSEGQAQYLIEQLGFNGAKDALTKMKGSDS